ncbi:site-specific DNA recombinase [Streptacidiphilus sp. MAP12-16]|uniref:recombinase family protein n=1 Tax=Streptacidiphilus sp. MAP12-16 TaxID=3156300 RepID=UPI00351504D9
MPELPHGAVYCWAPARHEPLQTTVAEQERLNRQAADALGIEIPTRHVFVDTQLTAWANNATPPAWQQMITSARSGDFRHLFLHRAERLDHLPHALAQLLTTAADHQLILHGHPRDLNDPLVRQAEIDRTQATCATREALAHHARTAHQEAAQAGRAHGGGLRAYGYTSGMTALIDTEAAVVQDIYNQYLAGNTRRAIALDLNHRSIPTATGKAWTVSGITRILDAPRYAGLRVKDGHIVRAASGRPVTAVWAPCVSLDTWQQTRRLRQQESERRSAERRPIRFYPLTGLAWCSRCERAMVGAILGTYPTYVCASASAVTPDRCARRIGAEPLEALVAEEAIRLLQDLDATSLDTSPAITAHPTTGLGARAAHRTVTIRPADALDGVVTGRGALFGWNRLPPEHKAQVLRYLFTRIHISATTTSRNTFDPNRVQALRRPAHHP